MDIRYKHNFNEKRIPSILLRNQDVQARLRSSNLVWIRQVKNVWESRLRNPILGCIVEIRSYQDQYCVHMDSPKGKKLIWTNCFS